MNCFEFIHNFLLVVCQGFGDGGKFGLQIFVSRLCGQLFGPVHGQIELAAAIVELTCFGGWVLVVVQQGACRCIQSAGKNFGFFVASLDAQIFERNSQGQEFAQRVPTQVILFNQLLHVFRCRAAGTRFVHAATGHQWHDGQHFGAGAQFHDGEQVGEVVAQDVAGGTDGVQTAHNAL